jgi:ribosomal protein S18 acetylase RimI-like enzyme
VTAAIRRLRASDVRPLVTGLWLPFAREMAALADRNALADDVDLVAAGVGHRRDRLDDEAVCTWVAVDDESGAEDDESGDTDAEAAAADRAVADGRLVGYAAAEVESSAPVFAAGDRLHVTELYVRPPRRGEGLGRRLLDRVRTAAAERGCEHVTLDVDAENRDAREFYEAVGFEPARLRMATAPDAE